MRVSVYLIIRERERERVRVRERERERKRESERTNEYIYRCERVTWTA